MITLLRARPRICRVSYATTTYPFRGSLLSTKSGQSYYDVLGVHRLATQQQIREAYFREAKKSHPDLNQNDPRAPGRFREVAEAYSTLKNEDSRARYDAEDMFASASGGGTRDHTNSSPNVDPNEVFKGVWDEMGLRDVEAYFSIVRDEVTSAGDAVVKHGDFSKAIAFVRARPGLVASVLLPLAMVLRFPGLVVAALRLVFVLPLVFFKALPPQLKWVLLHRLWARLVRFTANTQNKYKTKR